MNRLSRKNFLTLAAMLAAVLVLYIVSPGCVYRKFLGIECLGCGLTRGCFSLPRFQFAAAWHYNPISFAMPFWGVYLIWHGKIFRSQRLNRSVLTGLIVVTAVLALFRVYAMIFGS